MPAAAFTAALACPTTLICHSATRHSQGEAERLGARVAELDAEVESLRDTVAHLGESLANALAQGGAAADGAEPDAEWLAMISEARGERDALVRAAAGGGS